VQVSRVVRSCDEWLGFGLDRVRFDSVRGRLGSGSVRNVFGWGRFEFGSAQVRSDPVLLRFGLRSVRFELCLFRSRLGSVWVWCGFGVGSVCPGSVRFGPGPLRVRFGPGLVRV